MINELKSYVAVGVAFAALSAFGGLLWLNGNLRADLSASESARKEATSQRDAAIEANAKNTEALAILATYRALDNALLLKLQEDMVKWDEKLDAAKKSRDDLKRSDPDVKTFLDLPIPAALRVPKQAAGNSKN